MLTSLSQTQRAVFALVILAWIFATMGTFARALAPHFELFEQTYLRIGVAFLLSAVCFSKKVRWAQLRSISFKDFFVLFFRAVTLYLGVVLFTVALLNAKYGNAAFVAAIPLLPIFGFVFLKEKLRPLTLLFIVVGFLGIALIALKDFSDISFGYGEIMALSSLLAFDFSYIARRWQSPHLNNYESTVFILGAGAIFLFILSACTGEPFATLSDFTPFVILILLVSALFNVANVTLTNFGFQHVKAGVAGNILTLDTIFSLMYSVFLYGEIPSMRELFGGALVLLSVLAVNRIEE